jgi:hypothetical protein
MPFAIAAALALAAQSSPASVAPLAPQPSPAPAAPPAQTSVEYSLPIAGNWTFAATADGSEATFANEAGQAQLTIRCTRSTRRVAFLKPATAATPSLSIWTSSQTKSVPATYDAASGRVSTDFPAYDPFLDAIASSRGRIGFSLPGSEPLVVPPWADVGRVIEDCRV